MTRSRQLFAILAASASLFVAACGGGSEDAAGSGSGSTSAPTTYVQQQGTGIPFETFASPLLQTAISEKRLVTVRDADAWQKLWAEHAGAELGNRPAPAVDFSRNMVIGVFLGQRGACDKLSIEAVKQKQDPARIEVTYRDIPPPPNMACVASVVNLAVLATVPQSALPVEFVQAPARASGELVVRSGWSFGMCLDKCEGEVEIARDGASFRAANRKDPVVAHRALWGTVTAQEWDALVATSGTLPDLTVGCPDCADEGREWIEVERNGIKKRLEFSCNATVPQAQDLQKTVRAIRGRQAIALGLNEACNPDAIAFERIESPVFTSEITDKRFVTVRDATSWTTLWNQHTGGRATVPAIDFSTRMVLGVFMGKESVTCGSTSIASVRRLSSPDRIEVGYRVLDPGPNVMCIAALINQYALVSVPASPLPVEFVRLP